MTQYPRTIEHDENEIFAAKSPSQSLVRIIHYHSVKISGQNCNLLTSNTSIKCVIGELETNKILALLCS